MSEVSVAGRGGESVRRRLLRKGPALKKGKCAKKINRRCGLWKDGKEQSSWSKWSQGLHSRCMIKIELRASSNPTHHTRNSSVAETVLSFGNSNVGSTQSRCCRAGHRPHQTVTWLDSGDLKEEGSILACCASQSLSLNLKSTPISKPLFRLFFFGPLS